MSYTTNTDIRVFIKQKVHYLRVACFKPDERTWCVVLTDFGLHRSYASINSRITGVFTEPTMPIKKGFMNQIFNQSHLKGTKEIKTNKPVPEQYRSTLSVRTVQRLAMGSRTGAIALRFQAEARDFCPFHIVQTDSETRSASPSIRSGGGFADGRAAGRAMTTRHHLTQKLRMIRAIIH